MSEQQQKPTSDPAAGSESAQQDAADAAFADAESTGVDRDFELTEAKDRALRIQAEFENFRKRTRREQDDERKYANAGLLRDLLPVVDNIGRALEAAEKSGESGSLLEGVKLVGQQLQTVLARYHCTPIEALHAVFDPNLHEAVMQQPTAELPPGHVVAVTQVGYQLHDRVLRPTQVIVSAAPPSA